MSTPAVPLVALGSSGIVVSSLALGSWRTFERMAREDGVAVLRAARDAGITFLDDARYDDETGSAPMPSGYSEGVFGELFRGAGWPRAAAVVANKLWWEFWPAESAAQEIAGSLGRMGLDYVDLIYAALPPEGLPLAEAVEMTAALVTAGTARAWGTLNWPPALLVREAGAGRPGREIRRGRAVAVSGGRVAKGQSASRRSRNGRRAAGLLRRAGIMRAGASSRPRSRPPVPGLTGRPPRHQPRKSPRGQTRAARPHQPSRLPHTFEDHR